MRIAFIGNGRELLQPRAGNSLAVQTVGLAQALRERHELHVLTRTDRSQGLLKWRLTGAHKLIDGVHYHFLPSDVEVRGYGAPFSAAPNDDGYARKFLRGVIAKLRVLEADAILLWEAGAFAAAIRAALPRAKLLLHDAHGGLRREDGASVRKIADSVDHILLPAQFALRDLSASDPTLGGKLAHLAFGVDTDLFRALVPKGKLSKRFDLIRGESTMLTFVGRLTPEKGAHVVLDLYEACRSRIAKQPHVFLIGPPALDPAHRRHPDPFAGEKHDYVRRLQARAQALGDSIHLLLGAAPPPVIAGHLEAADVVVLPALAEQTSAGVIAEAIASGVGVIAYAGGVLDELIGRSEDLGTLVPRGDFPALCDAVVRHVERSPDERFERGKRAREIATTELTFATIAGKLERLIASA